jgi:hypothetical protein
MSGVQDTYFHALTKPPIAPKPPLYASVTMRFSTTGLTQFHTTFATTTNCQERQACG